MGYLYIMEAPNEKCVKIGISEHDVTARQRVIQTGLPEKIGRVWCSRNIPDYRELEKLMHLRFKAFKRHGEWFSISFFEACEEADRLCSLGKDGEKIRQLEKENAELRKRMETSFSIEEFATAITMMISQFLPHRD